MQFTLTWTICKWYASLVGPAEFDISLFTHAILLKIACKIAHDWCKLTTSGTVGRTICVELVWSTYGHWENDIDKN